MIGLNSIRLNCEDAAQAQPLRAQVVDFLQSRCRDDDDIAGAELIFGELLGNVVVHAPGPVEVSITWHEGQVLLAMWDNGPSYRFDASLPRDPFAERHRGLFIINALGRDLRVVRQGERNLTSVVLPVRFKPGL